MNCTKFLAALLFLLPTAVITATDVIPRDEAKITAVERGELTEAKASWWGFDPENSTAQLQAALDSGVPKLTIDKMESDWVANPLHFRSNMEIFFEEGTCLTALRGSFKGRGDSLCNFDRTENIAIHGNGAVLKMWKEDYLDPSQYELAEWRHAVSLAQAKNLLLEDLFLVQSGGDGIYVGASMDGECENVTIRRVVCDGNNRQGISIISVDGLTLEDCVFKNTGGTNPMAGLDVEPNNPKDMVKGIRIRNCFFDSNCSEGICFYLVQLDATSEPLDVIIENCITRNNGSNGFAFTTKTGGDDTQLKGKVLVKNCRFEGDAVGMLIQAKTVNGNILEFDNVKFVNPSAKSAPGKETFPAPIQIYSSVKDTAQFGKIAFNNIEVIDPIDREEFVYVDSSRKGVGITDLTGSITVRREESGPVVKTIELNNEYLNERFPQLNPKQVPLLTTEKDDFVPYSVLHAGKYPFAEGAPGIRARNQGDFRIYAEKGQTVKFKIREYPYGDCAKDPVVPKWTAPDGTETELEPCEFLGEKNYEIKAEQTGIYQLYIVVNPHNFVFSDCNCPFTYWAEPYGMTIQCPGTFYFYVPEGTPVFGLKMDTCPAEPIAFSVLDPSGNKAAEFPYHDTAAIWTSNENPEPGIWTLVIEDTEKKALDDICFNFLGIPSAFSTQKGSVFIKK